eukprot:Em0018g413a
MGSCRDVGMPLVPGDTVCVSLGDRIPADIRLVEVIDLEVDESSFTGESTPSHKHTQPQSSGASSSTHFGNVAYMGTFVCGGHGKGVVINTGERSEFGAVFKMMQSEEVGVAILGSRVIFNGVPPPQPPKTPLQKSMDMLGKQLSFYSLCIIGGIMLLGWLQGKKVLDMFTIGVSLAVAAIPEGLPIVVTVTLALGVMRMARKHAIIKKLPIVETLGCVNVVCSDKTGTLTENRMEVTDIYTASHHHASLLATPHSGIRDLTDAELFIPNSHPDVIKVVEHSTGLLVHGLAFDPFSADLWDIFKPEDRIARIRHFMPCAAFIDACDFIVATKGLSPLSANIGGAGDCHCLYLLYQQVGCVCNNAQIRDGKILGHPTEGAMMAAAQKLGLYSLRDQFVRTEERSFNSQQKWMAVRVRHRALQATDPPVHPDVCLIEACPLQPPVHPDVCLIEACPLQPPVHPDVCLIEACPLQPPVHPDVCLIEACPLQPPVQSEVWYMKGAIDVVLKYCTTESSGHRMTKELVQQYEGKAMEYGRRGMRVVAMACGSELSQLSFVGMMAMLDPPRPNVPHAVAKLKEGGVMVKMITGDSKETSESIARSLGLWEEGSVSLSGDELDCTDPLQLTDRILPTTVFYRVSPRHKVVIVKLSSSFVNEQHTLKF